MASTPSAEIVPVGTVGTAPPAHESATYLDALTLQRARVGYGTLGLHGELGYEGQGVSVQGQLFAHAFSTHPPARVTVELDGRYTRFRCRVALNDDVSRHGAHADFSVLADGRLVAQVPHVLAGTGAHDLTANVRDAHRLELVVHTSHWEYCHAVWLDPVVDAEPLTAETTLVDCLGRAEIMLPIGLPRTAHCVATVVTPGFAALLDNVLGSLNANGCCQDALLVVFAVNADDACARVAAKYGATLIPCQANTRVNATVKSILYSVARVVDADRYLCIDADMLVLDNLRPIFSALEACRAGSILACREGNGHDLANLEQALRLVYGGRPGDIVRLVGNAGAEGAYPLVVNDGLFAGDRSALLALDDTIRQWSHATRWVDERRDIWWRNQFVFNLALARLQSGVELDPTYNVQLHVQDVDLSDAAGGPRAMWRGTSVRVLHFSGVGRRKYPQLRDRFARIGTPLAGEGAGDSYGQFVAALRGWIARHGLPALAWSFYGTSDATSARVSDPSVFPLLAVLHYLIRANGCVRVLETGTARGVSTACLASAVAHRDSARVVTFDVQVYPARDDLWAALPEPMRACIEARTIDSLAGMAAAAEVGERYEAALLDTVHTAEHVMAEFQLAKELVCPGGLILVHDAQYTNGTVADALQRIEAEGYGVVRLWHAEAGANEDDGLGLAVIENRRRPTVAGAGAHSDVASVRLSSLYDRDDDV